jgi:hypothetical protein
MANHQKRVDRRRADAVMEAPFLGLEAGLDDVEAELSPESRAPDELAVELRALLFREAPRVPAEVVGGDAAGCRALDEERVEVGRAAPLPELLETRQRDAGGLAQGVEVFARRE